KRAGRAPPKSEIYDRARRVEDQSGALLPATKSGNAPVGPVTLRDPQVARTVEVAASSQRAPAGPPAFRSEGRNRQLINILRSRQHGQGQPMHGCLRIQTCSRSSKR